jgi:hypothetical protein
MFSRSLIVVREIYRARDGWERVREKNACKTSAERVIAQANIQVASNPHACRQLMKK